MPDAAFHQPLKRKAATLPVAYNVTLTCLKLVAALLTGSVSLLSEAVHSATDIVASAVAWFSIRAAAAPPDEDHPYGHGKIESLAGFGESILLLLIVVYVLVESAVRLLEGTVIKNISLGLWVMGFSAVTSFFVGRFVSKAGVETRSLALQSNGQHLMVDCLTSVGVLAALLITLLTGWSAADAVVAILLALWLGYNAFKLAHEAFHQLIDRRLPDAEIDQIQSILHEHDGILSFHRLRTRLSGNVRYIDMHVVVPNEWSVVQAHDCADALEDRLEEELAPAHVVIHVDPFDVVKADPQN